MFAVERHNKIRSILMEYKHINVIALSKMLGVTEATIRKDLELLNREGFLRRTHGGAVLEEAANISLSMPGQFMLSLQNVNVEAKRQIACICLRLINSKDFIFLDNGDISSYIADEIAMSEDISNLMVVTNNLYVTARLSEVKNVTVFCLGGQLSSFDGTPGFFSATALQQLNTLFVSKAFIEVDAVSILNGYMVSRRESYDLITKAMERANESYVVADYSKFDGISMYPLCSLKNITRVITNQNIPDNYKEYFFNNDIKLFTTVNPAPAE